MPVDPELLEILACPNCKTKVELVKNGTALKCGQCKRVYPIKDDIPVMLHRRGDDRTLTVRWSCGCDARAARQTREDSAHPPAAHRRRRLHDAARSARSSGRFPDARLTYLVERDAAPVVPATRTSHDVIVVAAHRGTAARLVTMSRWRDVCGASGSTSSSICTAGRAARG